MSEFNNNVNQNIPIPEVPQAETPNIEVPNFEIPQVEIPTPAEAAETPFETAPAWQPQQAPEAQAWQPQQAPEAQAWQPQQAPQANGWQPEMPNAQAGGTGNPYSQGYQVSGNQGNVNPYSQGYQVNGSTNNVNPYSAGSQTSGLKGGVNPYSNSNYASQPVQPQAANVPPQAAANPYAQNQYQQAPYQQPSGNKTLDILALCLGIGSVVFSFISWLSILGLGAGIAAIILASKAGKNTGTGKMSGMALAGLICGICGIVFSIPTLCCAICSATLCSAAAQNGFDLYDFYH